MNEILVCHMLHDTFTSHEILQSSPVGITVDRVKSNFRNRFQFINFNWKVFFLFKYSRILFNDGFWCRHPIIPFVFTAYKLGREINGKWFIEWQTFGDTTSYRWCDVIIQSFYHFRPEICLQRKAKLIAIPRKRIAIDFLYWCRRLPQSFSFAWTFI